MLDGSGKCQVEASGERGDLVWGVVYSLHRRDLASLHRAEGLGKGYEVADCWVEIEKVVRVRAFTYVARSDALDDGVLPFDWYRELVVRGAEENGLPADYVVQLRQQEVCSDPERSRARAVRALLEPRVGP